MQMKRMFNYKNSSFDHELSSIPHNFTTKHDADVFEMTIYGIIGETWFTDDYTTASDVDNALNDAGGKDVVIRLNSQGGSAFDGIAITNRLLSYKEQYGAKVTVHVDGYACSAGSLIPLAGDNVIMGAGAMIMIHQASTSVWGDKSAFRSQADLLEKLEDGIIDMYQTKANLSREELREKVDAETWFNAHEAVEIGFATTTLAPSKVPTNDDQVVNDLKNQVNLLIEEMQQLKNQNEKESTPAEKKKSVKRMLFEY